MIPQAWITCPVCGCRNLEELSADRCLYSYDCSGCGARLQPREGDCCIFCSYGSQRCPSAGTVYLASVIHSRPEMYYK